MIAKRLTLAIYCMALIGLAACDTYSEDRLLMDARYWQRANVREATYMEGPKAQQMLHRDISRCVTELRELDRLGSLHHALPGETTKYGEVPDPSMPEGAMDQWETPQRDGMLRAEMLPYHDFETCMQAKGWERLEYMPYEMADRARENYLDTIIGERYRSKHGERDVTSEEEGDWDNLNN
ncbi:MAG: hypothetical protein HY370_03575 [Proteobacteria bacterium]|nr:hypothetical protein [Pseudomonadota bacterium]